jgi:hypothetical protein
MSLNLPYSIFRRSDGKETLTELMGKNESPPIHTSLKVFHRPPTPPRMIGRNPQYLGKNIVQTRILKLRLYMRQRVVDRGGMIACYLVFEDSGGGVRVFQSGGLLSMISAPFG